MSQKQPARILAAVPSAGTICHMLTAQLVQWALVDQHEVDWIFPQGILIDDMRNRLAKRAVDDGYDFLIMIDADTVPLKNPLDLVGLDLDVIGLPTPIWFADANAVAAGEWPLCLSVFDEAPNGKWIEHPMGSGGLQAVDAVGTGAIIIARRVLEMLRPPFVRSWDEYGQAIVGSDVLFCRRAKAAGFKIWTHFDYLCSHYKTRDLLDMYRSLGSRWETPAGNGQEANHANVEK